MLYLCSGCKRELDSDKDLSYTLVNNVTAKRDVLCEPCVRQITNPKAIQVNVILREINDKQKKSGGQ